MIGRRMRKMKVLKRANPEPDDCSLDQENEGFKTKINREPDDWSLYEANEDSKKQIVPELGDRSLDANN